MKPRNVFPNVLSPKSKPKTMLTLELLTTVIRIAGTYQTRAPGTITAHILYSLLGKGARLPRACGEIIAHTIKINGDRPHLYTDAFMPNSSPVHSRLSCDLVERYTIIIIIMVYCNRCALHTQ